MTSSEVTALQDRLDTAIAVAESVGDDGVMHSASMAVLYAQAAENSRTAVSRKRMLRQVDVCIAAIYRRTGREEASA